MKNKLHSHDDRKIKTCPICQKEIRAVEKAGRELNRLGIWNIPKKIKKNTEYIIWKRK